MNNKTKTIIGILIFAILIWGATITYNYLIKNTDQPENLDTTQKDNTTTEEKIEALDFTVLDKDGNEIKLSELIGKPIVLNFWASWCGPCKSEMPDFNTVYEEMGEDITFVMVNATDGQRETMDIGKKYIEDNAFTFPVYYDTKQDASYNYGVSSIPATYFIDKDGYIVAAANRAINEKTLRKGIDLIKENAKVD